MTSSPEPEHLNNTHRNTVNEIFRHPAGHNIEWHAVVSLLDAVATVEERSDGKLVVTLGPETEVFERPPDKDIDTQQVVDLRRMLAAAGYSPDESDNDH